MSGPIDMTNVQHRFATGEEPSREARFDPYTGQPLPVSEFGVPPRPTPDGRADHERIEEQFIQPPLGAPQPAANPYAPTGWQGISNRVEFDITLPSGQLCRMYRLEREDLFRIGMLQYLDTFTPMLMSDDSESDESRERKMKTMMQNDADALSKMFMAIDEVCMAATTKPKITNDKNLVDYGQPKDWANPQFTAVAYIHDIKMEDRMAIFAGAFGKSMDDLKSLFQQATGLGSLADVTGVQQTAQ